MPLIRTTIDVDVPGYIVAIIQQKVCLKYAILILFRIFFKKAFQKHTTIAMSQL